MEEYVTVIIDLTPILDGAGPARLLDMIEGRSKKAFKTWLAQRPHAWREQVEVVAMDGFTGYKSATSEELPEAVAVVDPSVRPAGTPWLTTSMSAATASRPWARAGWR